MPNVTPKSPFAALDTRLLAATKALSGAKEIHFAFAANQQPDGLERTTTILLPAIPETGAPDAELLAHVRGEADLAALLLRHHRAAEHQHNLS